MIEFSKQDVVFAKDCAMCVFAVTADSMEKSLHDHGACFFSGYSAEFWHQIRLTLRMAMKNLQLWKLNEILQSPEPSPRIASEEYCPESEGCCTASRDAGLRVNFVGHFGTICSTASRDAEVSDCVVRHSFASVSERRGFLIYRKSATI